MLHQIGAGVLGPVFRAYQPDPGRLVAVKQFRLDIPPDSAHRFVAALDRLIAADLTHSGIAAPLAAGLESLTPFLAQDFVAADSFDVVMRDHGPTPVAEALRVATQLAGALDFAAAVNVVHGSLHPRDVLISAEDTRITGLGIAQALQAIGLTPPVRRPYAAPERVAGTTWDRRADVFSTAALIYEMLFGRRIAGLGDAAAESITAVEGADPDALRVLFARALAEHPDNRFDTVLAFAEALHTVLAGATQQTRGARPRRKRDTNGASTRRVPPPSLPLEEDLPLAPAALDLPMAPPELQAPLDASEPQALHDLDLRASAAPRYAQVESAAYEPATTPTAEHLEAPDAEAAPPPHPAHDEGVRSRVTDSSEVHQDATPAGAPYADDPGVSEPAPHPGPSFGSVAMEQGRSAVWPIALALVVGLAVGFALGYGSGTRERAASLVSASPAAAVAPPDVVAPQADAVPVAPPAIVPPNAPAAAVAAPAQPAAQTAGPDAPAASSIAPRSVASAEPAPAPAPDSARPDPSPRAAVVSGRLVVRSTPAGARVTVDGREAGVTPASVRDLAVGPHVVRIAHQGYVTAERRVRIRTAQTAQSIEVELEASRPARQVATPAAPPERTSGRPADAPGAKAGSLMVDSRPAGARVFVDGKLVGSTPLLLDAVEAGDHSVRLELDGFRTWTAGTKITGGERTRVSGSLEQR